VRIFVRQVTAKPVASDSERYGERFGGKFARWSFLKRREPSRGGFWLS
jgi:hypothetical protein